MSHLSDLSKSRFVEEALKGLRYIFLSGEETGDIFQVTKEEVDCLLQDVVTHGALDTSGFAVRSKGIVRYSAVAHFLLSSLPNNMYFLDWAQHLAAVKTLKR